MPGKPNSKALRLITTGLPPIKGSQGRRPGIPMGETESGRRDVA